MHSETPNVPAALSRPDCPIFEEPVVSRKDWQALNEPAYDIQRF